MLGVPHVLTTQRGKPSLVDINNFSYTTNGFTSSTQYWRGGATLTTRKSSGNLVGENLSSHIMETSWWERWPTLLEKLLYLSMLKFMEQPPLLLCKRLASELLYDDMLYCKLLYGEMFLKPVVIWRYVICRNVISPQTTNCRCNVIKCPGVK